MTHGLSKRHRSAGGRGGGTSSRDPGSPPSDEGLHAGAGVRDLGREAAVARARRQSAGLRGIRRDLDCEPPWDIGEVAVSSDGRRYDVWVFDVAGYWPCPTCACQLAGDGHTPTHVFRCLTCDTETYVYVKIPMVDCPTHGRQRVRVPWNGHHTKWSYSRTLSPDALSEDDG